APPLQATTLSSASTSGYHMAGTEVTVNFFSGGSETVSWIATDSMTGIASGTNWSMSQSNNTFSGPWIFNYSGLDSVASLMINVIPGNTTFDTISGREVTPGSGNGRLFTLVSGQGPDSFNYSVPIDISSGDLFGTLSMSWNQGFTGMMSFIADTDSGTMDDPVTPVEPTPVPEPTSVLGLLAVSAFGAASTWKRKHQQDN
ncbi:MAG TPA: hypothetical protein DCP31_26725, partial [Cyanobacteria bacterium UBA8543]|nr:hypothetical protein [Cyanobacteria bacterium UBA8543]